MDLEAAANESKDDNIPASTSRNLFLERPPESNALPIRIGPQPPG
jgi:hypothetical protein